MKTKKAYPGRPLGRSKIMYLKHTEWVLNIFPIHKQVYVHVCAHTCTRIHLSMYTEGTHLLCTFQRSTSPITAQTKISPAWEIVRNVCLSLHAWTTELEGNLCLPRLHHRTRILINRRGLRTFFLKKSPPVILMYSQEWDACPEYHQWGVTWWFLYWIYIHSSTFSLSENAYTILGPAMVLGTQHICGSFVWSIQSDGPPKQPSIYSCTSYTLHNSSRRPSHLYVQPVQPHAAPEAESRHNLGTLRCRIYHFFLLVLWRLHRTSQ
jgi:hypothetical protein